MRFRLQPTPAQEAALRDFAQAMAIFFAGPDTGEVVDVDRGVAVSAALSTGELLSAPALRKTEAKGLKRLQRGLNRSIHSAG
jgi:hypothetical protein